MAAPARPDPKEVAGAATQALARGGGAATALDPNAGDASAAVAAPGAGLSSPYASFDQSSAAFESAPATLMTPPQPFPSPTKPAPVPAVLLRPSQPNVTAGVSPSDSPRPPLSPHAAGSAAYAAAPPAAHPAAHPAAGGPPHPTYPNASPHAQGPTRDASDFNKAAAESITFTDPRGRPLTNPPHPTAATPAPAPGPEAPTARTEDQPADAPPHPGTSTNISMAAPADPGSTHPGTGPPWVQPTPGGVATAPGDAPDARGAPRPPTNGHNANASVPFGSDARKVLGAPSGFPPGDRYASAYGVLPTADAAQDSLYAPHMQTAVPPLERPPPPPVSNQQFHRFHGAQVRWAASQSSWQHLTPTRQHDFAHMAAHCERTAGDGAGPIEPIRFHPSSFQIRYRKYSITAQHCRPSVSNPPWTACEFRSVSSCGCAVCCRCIVCCAQRHPGGAQACTVSPAVCCVSPSLFSSCCKTCRGPAPGGLP